MSLIKTILFMTLIHKQVVPKNPNFGKPEPVAEIYLGNGFFIDFTLPVFSDPNLRVGGIMAAELKVQGTLEWNFTVGGCDEHGTQAFMIQPLPVNPYNGIPTYFFTHNSYISVIKTYGKPH